MGAVSDAAAIERLERERVRALEAGDLDAVRELQADDFQLITPSGEALSTDDYLGHIESGRFRYVRRASSTRR
jgi:hypothetical protein